MDVDSLSRYLLNVIPESKHRELFLPGSVVKTQETIGGETVFLAASVEQGIIEPEIVLFICERQLDLEEILSQEQFQH
jgi:hypothetical protein